MQFTDIIGHDRPVRILKRAIEHDSLAHAYLFSGDEGVGKKMTARALAAAVNCADRGPDGGCGACPSCRATATANHPDVHLVAADGTEIKIDQMREAQATLALKPFEGRKKILLVDGADTMNTAAANAFLKTLEEPPGETVIILITALPRSLLSTIRSRCQEIVFQPLPRRSLTEYLMGKRGYSENDARLIASQSRGSLGKALAMDVEQEKAAHAEMFDLWSQAGTLGADALLVRAEALGKDRERFERMLTTALAWLRDVMVCGITGNESLLVHAGQGALARQWYEAMTLPRIFQDLDTLNAGRELLDRRVSGQLVAEHVLLKLGKG